MKIYHMTIYDMTLYHKTQREQAACSVPNIPLVLRGMGQDEATVATASSIFLSGDRVTS